MADPFSAFLDYEQRQCMANCVQQQRVWNHKKKSLVVRTTIAIVRTREAAATAF